MKLSLVIIALAVSMAAGLDFSQLRKMDDISREDLNALVESMVDLADSEEALADTSDENMNVLADSLLADKQAMGALLVYISIWHNYLNVLTLQKNSINCVEALVFIILS